MVCGFCKSENLKLKNEEGKIGLYCVNCGRWQKWVTPQEAAEVQRQIEKQKNELRIDGRDLERVREKYGQYKARYKRLNDEILYSKDAIARGGSDLEKSALYEKVIRLKEMSIKLSAYDEILMDLRLK